MSRNLYLSICALSLASLGSACNGVSGEAGSAATLAGAAAGASHLVGEGCHSSDPDHLCLAVHYVSYKDGSGTPVSSEDQALRNIAFVNGIWKQCNIGFQIEKYDAVNPVDKGLAYGAEAVNQLDPIRAAYGDNSSLLVVLTGPWGTVKNAWTEMPGGGRYYGAIFESSVADYPQIMAHELGHYLNLPHPVEAPAELPGNVMNWKIYPDSTELTRAQCDSARAAAKDYWKAMLR